jgi:hypothetical protein
MTMGTASTMTAIAEALGLTLPGASVHPGRRRQPHPHVAAQCGRRIVDMVWEDLTPDKILTPRLRQRRHRRHGDRLLDQRDHPPDRHGAPRRCRSRRSTTSTRSAHHAADRQHPAQRQGVPDGGLLLRRGLARADAPARRPLDGISMPHRQRQDAGENLEGAEVFNDDVIVPLEQPGLPRRARSRCCAATSPPTARHQARGLRSALLVHEGRAVVSTPTPR